MNKYKVTDETIEYRGNTLHRIEATENFGVNYFDEVLHIRKGDKGGFVENKRNLDQSKGNAWIKDNAKVYNYAVVSDTAVVSDNAVVKGFAVISDNARIFDNAWVDDKARVSGKARVSDDSIVFDNSSVLNESWVRDNAKVFGGARIKDNAIITNRSHVLNNTTTIGGYGLIKSDKDYLTIAPIGFSRHPLNAFKNKDGGVTIKRESFTGSLQEFEDQVEEIHEGSEYRKEYKGAIQFIKTKFGIK